MRTASLWDKPLLWINPSDQGRFGHALKSQHLRRGAVVNLALLRFGDHFLKGIGDMPFELFVNLALLSEEGLQILRPFKVADDHAAAIA